MNILGSLTSYLSGAYGQYGSGANVANNSLMQMLNQSNLDSQSQLMMQSIVNNERSTQMQMITAEHAMRKEAVDSLNQMTAGDRDSRVKATNSWNQITKQMQF